MLRSQLEWSTKSLTFSRSFFQCVCVLGYCLVPCVCAALGCALLSVASGAFVILVKLAIAVAACLWAIYGKFDYLRRTVLFCASYQRGIQAIIFAASTAFLSGVSIVNRKALMIYPICLFYAIITCMVVSHF